MSGETPSKDIPKENSENLASEAVTNAKDGSKVPEDLTQSDSTIEKENEDDSDSVDSALRSENCKQGWQRIRMNREICYRTMRYLFSLSRHLESHYRYDDILVVKPNMDNKLSISIFSDWLARTFNEVKRNLTAETVQPTINFKDAVKQLKDSILAVPVSINYEEMDAENYEFQDWVTVRGSLPEFSKYDGGRQTSEMNYPRPDFKMIDLQL